MNTLATDPQQAAVDAESGEVAPSGAFTALARRTARAKEAAKTDYVRSEVDRANREELPKLGGTIDDTWEPGR